MFKIVFFFIKKRFTAIVKKEFKGARFPSTKFSAQKPLNRAYEIYEKRSF